MAATLQAPALYRALVERRAMGLYGQFFLVKEADNEALDLRFQPLDGPTVSVTLEERLLRSTPFSPELRQKAAELFRHAVEVKQEE
ncbi:MAG TPA: hypothetical protein VGH90_12130 [Chthoniobacteraceae bacterium]